MTLTTLQVPSSDERKIDFDYLKEIETKIGNKENIMWGFAFEGSKFGIIGYSICNHPTRKIKYRDGEKYAAVDFLQAPHLFYANSLTNIGISESLRLLDKIAEVFKVRGLKLIVEGEHGHSDVVVTTIKRRTRLARIGDVDEKDKGAALHSVLSARSKGGRHFHPGELATLLVDDLNEGIIVLAPEFRPREERTLLDEELADVDPTGPLTVLQKATIWGLGWWSGPLARPKYSVPQLQYRIW